MHLKEFVNIHGLHPKMQIANCRAAVVWFRHDQELVITSGLEGTHSEKSLHYRGRACDYRTSYFSREKALVVAEELRQVLGPDYDVVVENTHIHCEYDPSNPKII